MVQAIVKHSSDPMHLDLVYETDMAEGLKAMAFAGARHCFCLKALFCKVASG